MRCPIWYAFAFGSDVEELVELCSHFDCDVCAFAPAEAPWAIGWADLPEEEDRG